MRGTRHMYEFRQQVISKRSVDDQCHALMSYWDFYAARRRRLGDGGIRSGLMVLKWAAKNLNG